MTFRFLLTSGLLALLGAGASEMAFGVEPGCNDIVAAVRATAAKGEIHVVSVGDTVNSGLRYNHITDWPGLVAGLRSAKDPSASIRTRLPKKIQENLLEKDALEQFDLPAGRRQANVTKLSELQGNVALTLKDIVEDGDFYKEKVFRGVELDDGLKTLIAHGAKRTTRQTALMNWELLRATFPNTISDPHPFRTIQVQVRAGTDVVLVLSCYNNCLWKADVQPGGKVVGVVLCGYHGQEIEIHENPVRAPVVYRARYRPDGTDRHGEGDYFRADGRNAKQRGAGNDFQPQAEKVSEKGGEKFVTELKKITGKDFVSFQFNPEPGPKDGPFVVPPKEKK